MDIQKIINLTEQYKNLSADRIALSQHIGDTSDERRAVAIQASLKNKLKRKLPSWFDAQVYIPSQLNLEQASSEPTALHKRKFVQNEDILLDLTGGMGVDFWALSSVAQRSIYTEQNEELANATEYNLGKLCKERNIELIHADSMLLLEDLLTKYEPTLIYVDPARREDQKADKRVYALEDCTPSLQELILRIRALQDKAIHTRILAKVSPMLDITHTLRTIDAIEGVHCIALRGEVKEILLEIYPNSNICEEERLQNTRLTAYNIDSQGNELSFSGTLQEEQTAQPNFSSSLGTFLYEPFGSLLKLGLYNLISERLSVGKLHPNSQLYTNTELIENFPGRKFRILEIIPYESKIIKRLKSEVPKAQITCRNFPLSAEVLRKKLKIEDSNEATIVATTLYDGSLVMILCEVLP